MSLGVCSETVESRCLSKFVRYSEFHAWKKATHTHTHTYTRLSLDDSASKTLRYIIYGSQVGSL